MISISQAHLSIIHDRSDPVALTAPVRWALGELTATLKRRHVPYRISEGSTLGKDATLQLLLGGAASPTVRAVVVEAGVALSDKAESLGLIRAVWQGEPCLVVVGVDARGLVYALLELADRVTYADDPIKALQTLESVIETPANTVRGINRLFTSEVEDKSWFYDKDFWSRYLTMLASHRFNRLHLAFGMGYDGPNHVVTDSYLHFAYPFLVSVPGYDVQVEGLAEGEREQNLAMLRWISEQAELRGIHFQLGLWIHIHEFPRATNVSHPVVGLPTEQLAPYCRDALRTLLKACPAIQGVTLRSHYESGIPEGTYDFWSTIFEGVATCGRKVEIDLHTKGLDHNTIANAVATGQPVNTSTKFWAEHMGLPYHQASIRELERSIPRGEHDTADPKRRFTRYGYGDYLREDRTYGVFYRLWPGTQRLLLWGDPIMAAAYSRAGGFCGGLGIEICEPLSFKGRQGSGIRNGRQLYADPSLRLSAGSWQKYLYTYRLWGRLLYNPESSPETWQRYLRHEFSDAAPALESALAQASRILPLVTTAHLPSAANNHNWMEMQANMPIVDEKIPHPHSDMPTPKRLAFVSPLDPALFSSVDSFPEAFLQGKIDARHTPLEVAKWLDDLAEEAERQLELAQAELSASGNPEFRRVVVDITVQIKLGHFFAHKLRAGVAYAMYERTRDVDYLQDALSLYRGARDAWAELVQHTVNVYFADLTFGPEAHKRGHWADRLAGIDYDLRAMEHVWQQVTDAADVPSMLVHDYHALAVRAPLPAACTHAPPEEAHPGLPLQLEFAVQNSTTSPIKVWLHYRQVNQAEAFTVQEMSPGGQQYCATIPAEVTESPYPLMYFFELRDDQGHAWLYPGLSPDFSGQPYFVVPHAQTVAETP